MQPVTFEAFAANAREQGFDDVLERRWGPDMVVASHTHPFSVRALVVQGEMWLTVGEEVRHIRTDDSFALERDVAHSERYGSEGTTLWVARR